jgi:hypothetical protein
MFFMLTSLFLLSLCPEATCSDKVGRCILFLEAIQTTIVPYVVEIVFPFPEFVGWCVKQYAHEETVIMNKQGPLVLCRIEKISI